MTAFLLCCLYRSLEVTKVIETVKYSDYINTICKRFLYEIFYYIICIMVVAEDVLASEKHLKLGILEARFELAKSLPWIFLQETKAGIKCSSSPALNSVVTNLIHLVYDRKHFFCCHSCSYQGLMCVTKDSFDNLNSLITLF